MPTFAVEPLTEATARVLGAAGTPEDIAAQAGALADQREPVWDTPRTG